MESPCALVEGRKKEEGTALSLIHEEEKGKREEEAARLRTEEREKEVKSSSNFKAEEVNPV